MKSFFKRTCFILLRLPSVLLLLGCIFVFFDSNFLSFGFSLILPVLFVLNVIIGVYWLIEKNKFFLFSVFCLIGYFLCFDSFLQFNLDNEIGFNRASLKSNTLSLLTYNTSSFKVDKGAEEGDIVRFIKSKNPDVFCIQEFSAIKYKYLNDYPYWYKTNIFTKDKSVMAIFSKYPIIDKGYIEFPNTSNGAMYVDLNINEKQIRLYNLHLESFKVRSSFYDFSESTGYNSLKSTINKAEKKRIEQVAIINEHISNFNNGKVIICGDFNSTQFSSAYATLKNLKKDTFIEKGFGLGATYTRRNYPFRIDYILVDNDIEVLSHQNFNLKLSDHEPVYVELEIN